MNESSDCSSSSNVRFERDGLACCGNCFMSSQPRLNPCSEVGDDPFITQLGGNTEMKIAMGMLTYVLQVVGQCLRGCFN